MVMKVYGPSFSTYVRTVRLALAEKGVPHELVAVAMLSGEHRGGAYRRLHPFARVPALDHDGFVVYESSAILRYLDDVLPGAPLCPVDPRARARMEMLSSVLDSYGYAALVTRFYVQRVLMPTLGRASDEAAIAEGKATGAVCLGELDRLLAEGGGPYVGGPDVSMADLKWAPVIDYLSGITEGVAMLAGRPALLRWWEAMRARPSMAATQPAFG